MRFLLYLVFVQNILLRTSVPVEHSPKSPVKRLGPGIYSCPTSPVTARYGDPSNRFCLYYFLCHKGHAFPRRCEPRQVFHPVTLECKPREEVPEYICPFEIMCGYNGFQPDPKDCTKYFLCFYRQPTHYSCTEGKIFNATSSTCVTDKVKATSCSKPKASPHHDLNSKERKSISTVKPLKKSNATKAVLTVKPVTTTLPPPPPLKVNASTT